MPTYPEEAFPTDAIINALDGTRDETTGLDYIARGTNANSTPSYEVQYNRREQRLNAIIAAIRQGMVVDEGNLMIGVYPIRYTIAGIRLTFDGATGVSVPDDNTTRLFLDQSATLQLAADYPIDPSVYLPLATVTSAGGSLSIDDERALAIFRVS